MGWYVTLFHSFNDKDQECRNHRCLIQNEIIKQVNNDGNWGWQASNYRQFSEKKLKDGLIYKLGKYLLQTIFAIEIAGVVRVY